METYEALISRRSIRRYEYQELPDTSIEKLLTAAMHAPSSKNLQPWHFIVIRDRKNLEAITAFHPFSKMLHKASAAILVCGDTTLNPEEKYLLQDCSAATQNLLLAAHDMGLGGVWLGINPRPERMEGMRQLCQLPDHIIPISLVSIGYPLASKPQPERYQPERIQQEVWQER